MNPSTVRSAPRTPWKRRALALSLLAGAVTLLVTACDGGSGTASVASLAPATAAATVASGATPASSTAPSALAYARCMRAHGVTDFPDPDADGNIRLDAGPGSDLNPDSTTFKDADGACASLLPASTAPADAQAATLKYAACMREHGVKDFPDPKDGGLQIQATPGSDLDPENPAYKAADKACKQLLPDGGEGRSTDTVDG